MQVALILWREHPQSYAELFKVDRGGCTQQWFDHFGSAGNAAFQFGAKALADFAIAHREEVLDSRICLFETARAGDEHSCRCKQHIALCHAEKLIARLHGHHAKQVWEMHDDLHRKDACTLYRASSRLVRGLIIMAICRSGTCWYGQMANHMLR